ncbi:MAG: hypothetical protein AAF488_02275 [Planctomycetota bacterium]
MTTAPAALHFAVTSHGLGHLTRSLAVLRALQELRPDARLHVSTTANPEWIRGQLDHPVEIRDCDYEPGALQRNCFEVDVPATRLAYRKFRDEHAARLERELAFLRAHDFAGVVTDISGLAVHAAAEAGLPAIGVSNFTWDWIIEPWCENAAPEEAELPELLRADYARGTTQLRLPFGPDRSSFPTSEPAPLVARTATRTRAEVRRVLGFGDEPLAVVCPGGWSADEWPAIVARPGRFRLITVGDLPVTANPEPLALSHELPGGLRFPDLVAGADVVLGKPGYGLASECLRHRVPFAMIERPEFRETPHLVQEVLAAGHGSTATIDQFFAGDWEPMLERALIEGTEWTPQPEDPAGEIARRILEICGA